jgi:prepilin-type N-terminal cleavage/methylation domain-containing protein
MISTIGTPIANNPKSRAFTLVELILVMVLMVVLLALIAPFLSNSLRQHNLEQAAAQCLAVTEYARDEAVSQSVPMTVWLNPKNGQYGADPVAGYPAAAGRSRQYHLAENLHFAPNTTVAAADGVLTAAQFSPDGTLDITSSLPGIDIQDRYKHSISLAQRADGDGYEIVKDIR